MQGAKMQGTLLKYGEASHQTAFLTGTHARHLVMVGGLTDGFFACRYVPRLAEALDGAGWSLVQPLLASSYQGYGTASLDGDAADLQQLAVTLRDTLGSRGMVVMGHSTGAQDAVRYAMRHRSDPSAAPLLGAVLQAGCSDRESAAEGPGTAPSLAKAREMVEAGMAEEIMPRDTMFDRAPVTARRFLDLYDKGGDDDMFSSDLTDEELRERLGHMKGLPTLVLFSGADEFVPASIDKQALMKRLVDAMGGPPSRWHLLEGANHGAWGHEDAVVREVLAFLEQLQ